MIINITKPDAEVKKKKNEDKEVLFNNELLIASLDVKGDFNIEDGQIIRNGYNIYVDGVKAE